MTALDDAAAELERRPGGIAGELEREDWRWRMEQAMRDGLDLKGPAAVHDALAELADELGIKPAKGAKPKPIPAGVVKAARRWLAAVLANPPRKPPSLGSLARTASTVEPITRQGIREWIYGHRSLELMGIVLGEDIENGSQRHRRAQEQRRLDQLPADAREFFEGQRDQL